MKQTRIFVTRVDGEVVAKGTTAQVAFNCAMDYYSFFKEHDIDGHVITVNGHNIEEYL